ncbi:MAG: dipeptide/oligopeptide/nickel ABC transporter permease/ATP-binding protein [Mesorhizobium sp.]|uniref:dipeptide/oligopeptide/nickel ABC transporter permease/ATP-binding protein n=1 Tax=Mesorhizobium sp. TaxID=1871066 RepID=UPI000FE4D6CA|nr:dipeptide/oligopeptide/nickel ABC transporter permease/ATP-binding protein [Mesorhizobium sp.]RWE82203.1 MAG: dipeptide/oligopeptide/nickel ABC transporter permease/ATP-binding protein [Mesorhizobium sp.]TJW65772.1 MAG: dipeptide/oligopeptide/nickel ABC transporter permease/ATP-binding protein [Mesorhizobium sp.]
MMNTVLGTYRRLPSWQRIICIVWLVIIVLTVVGPWIVPYRPEVARPDERLLPPDLHHWFGTDENGIDIFSRILTAPRTDVLIASLATALSVLIGAPLGIAAGLLESSQRLGGMLISNLLMRLLDLVQAFPVFIFAIVLVALFGGTSLNIVLAIAFVNAPVFLRLVRSEVLTLRRKPFAEAAVSVGNSELMLGVRHMLPNALPTIIVQISVTVGFSILLTAGLSFVGAGIKPPTPELGNMVASGAPYLMTGQWWVSLIPGAALGLIVFSFGVVGEVLNIALHQRRRPAEPATVSVPATPMSETAKSSIRPVSGKQGIFEVRGLSVSAGRGSARRELLSGIDLSIVRGETLAIVGESGSGKTILARALLNVLPKDVYASAGTITYNGSDLLAMPDKQVQALRGSSIAAILPNPRQQLHPLTTIGEMMIGALRAHRQIDRSGARHEAMRLLSSVGITDPETRLSAYPHELSGGMAQRVCVALAIMHSPSTLIADEPTAGLDVTIQRQVLDLIHDMVKRRNMAQVIITGDLGIAAHFSDRTAVMRAGRILEINTTEELFRNPQHEHTRYLIDAAAR